MTKNKVDIQSWLLLIVLSLVWGSSFILIKQAVVGLSPVHVASLRVFLAGLFLLPFAIRALKNVPKSRLKYFLVAGSIGNLMPSFLFALAMPHIQSSVSGILNSLSPLFTLITGVLLWKQKFPIFKVLGVVVGMIGCIVLVLYGGNGFEMDINYYALLVVLATVMYGLNTNILKDWFQDVKSIDVASLSLMCICPIAGVIFFSTGGWEAVWSSEQATISAGYTLLLSFASSAMALILFMTLIQRTSAIFAASVTYLMPVVSIFWGLQDQEAFGAPQLIGVCVILLAVFLIRKK